MKDRFPHYKAEQANSMVLIIKDKTVHDEKTDKDVVETLKDMTDVNAFFDKLQAFCKSYGFEIDASGTREQVAARLYKKDGKSLITESEAAEFGKYCFHNLVIIESEREEHNGPTIELLHNWRKEADDMK